MSDSSLRRQRRVAALISSGALDERDSTAVLGDAGDTDMPICRKRRGGPDSGFTLASAVFAVAGDRVDWRVHSHPLEVPEFSGSHQSYTDPDGAVPQ